MKKTILTLLVLLMVAGTAMADGRKKAIQPSQLPTAAQTLIQKHWPSCNIQSACTDGRKEYEVLLTDGCQIEFDLKGNWKEMKCNDGLPVTLVPAYITRYVVNRYPKLLIIDVEKMRGGYEVELSNGLEIQFDLKGNVTHVDD